MNRRLMGNNHQANSGSRDLDMGQLQGPRSLRDLTSSVAKRAGIPPDETIPRKLDRQRVKHSQKKPLRIMKFGGTSVGDVYSIDKVVEIIREAASESNVVVVVSAMSGVTNQLIEAATQAESGNRKSVAMIFEELRKRHEAAIGALVHSAAERSRIAQTIGAILQEGDQVCQVTILLRELTLRTCDAISSLGERLSAPLLAAALADCGMASEAIEATELLVTDSYHGGAEPRMTLTRERSEARLRPLLEQGIVAVGTGFIGATEEGVLTTLGRGGSDYSATILGAALDADEVIIWTDVDGVLTADPRQVPEARTLREISYSEASEMAYYGAKVLHPKTLRPVSEAGIPVWIRNSFLPERSGTQITTTGHPTRRGVKAITAMTNVTLITVGGRGIVGLPGVAAKTFTAAASAQADALLISHSSSGNDICFIMYSGDAARTVSELRGAFAADLAHSEVAHITVNEAVA